MLGGFFAFTFIGILGLNYWIGFAAAVAAMALFGMLAERVVVRPILGYPQFSIIMATIGLGYFQRRQPSYRKAAAYWILRFRGV
jgi:branched-chain amino acid transport system permease protein